MKKCLSVILIAVLILGTVIILPFSASAASNMVFDLAFGVTQSGHTEKYSINAYKFTLNAYTTLTIDYDSYEPDMISGNYGDSYKGCLFVIKSSDYNNLLIGKSYTTYFKGYVSKGNNKRTWYDGNMSLYAGSYYLIIVPYDDSIGISSIWVRGSNDYTLSVTPTVSKLKSLSAVTSTGAVKLQWKGDLSAGGYQIQRKSNSYQTIANTSSTSYTDKSRKPGTVYTYRVRGYTTVGGKKYYGPWSNYSAVTLPATPTIKNPSANAKHQISANWVKANPCTGYQVQFSLNQKFSSSTTTKTFAGQNATRYTITGKKEKVYYIRIRAYKKAGGKYYYSAWSKTKSVRCK